MIKSIVIISDHSPIGKNSARETLRLVSGFVGLGVELDCKVILTGDAVLLMNKHSNPKAIGADSFDEAFEMLELTDSEIYLLDTALEEVGLTKDDLIDYENLKVISLSQMVKFIEQADMSFRF